VLHGYVEFGGVDEYTIFISFLSGESLSLQGFLEGLQCWCYNPRIHDTSYLQHLRQFTRPVAGDTMNYYSEPMKSVMARSKYIGHSQEPKTPCSLCLT
jgi:trimethylamine:corrinoid methyltransferase-like protein